MNITPSPRSFKSLPWLALGAAALLLATPAHSNGAVLVEDFTYTAGQLLSKGSASGGWSSAWTGGSNNLTSTAANLSITGVSGYQVVQSGNGRVETAGSSNSLNLRSFTEVTTGDLWLSVLLHNPAGGRTGVHLDVTGGTSRDNAALGMILVGTDARRVQDGVMTTTGLRFSEAQTHLVLAKVTPSTGAVSFWVNPTDVTSTALLGAASFSFTSTTIGTGIGNVAVETYSGGRLDALRLGRSLYEVTGQPAPIPEPATAALLLSASLLLLNRWRQGRRDSAPTSNV